MERDREQWKRLRPILEDLLELDPEEREAVLADRVESEELRAAAWRFLREEEALDDARDPLARPAVEVDSGRLIGAATLAASGPPERAGPWEFRRRLGTGGMGEVWLAVRTQGGFSQRAAVKRLHAGFADDEVLARFERERALLGSIEDPSIARLIDGGLDDQGRPYIAMEFVDGEPIDAWCNARRATVRERVELLVRVALCVDAAHEVHVVHRDIKPSNVLVDGQGRPRLIDFGVAKVLDPAKDTALVTRDAARYLTPLYASLEQFVGKPPTPASDVYSLGVLAYVLLTGEAPLELTGLGPAESMRIIRDERPVALAVRAGSRSPEVAKARGTTPKGLIRALDHDLDTVVRYCLRKEPTRRYGRARDLANDLQRWLDGQTVLARKDHWSYRTRRFVSRNRAVVTVTLVAFALLAGALLTVLTQRRDLLAQTEELDQRNEEARRLIDDLRSTIADSTSVFYRQLAVIPGTSEVLKRMSESLAATASRHDDPRLLTEAVRAYGLLANGAWAPFAQQPCDPEASYAAYLEAESLGLRMLEGHAETDLMSGDVADALSNRAWADCHRGRLEALVEDAPRLMAWFEARIQPNPVRSDGVLAGAVVNAYRVQRAHAYALERLGRPLDALGCLDSSLTALGQFTPDDSIAGAIARYEISATLRAREHLALTLGLPERNDGDPRSSSAQPTGHGASSARARHLHAARLRAEGHLDRARTEMLAALRAAEDTAHVDLERDVFPKDLLVVRAALADLELGAGRADDALLHASAALEMLETALGDRPTAWVEGEDLRQTRLLAGRARIAGGDPVEGARLVGLALDHAKRELERCPRNFFARLSAVDAACELAALQGEAAEAAEWRQRAERILGAAEAGAGTERQLAERHARISALRSGNR